MSENDKIDELLDRWNDGFRPDSSLAARVRTEAQRGESRSFSVASWMGVVFARPGLVAGFAAVFVLVGMGLSQLISGGIRESGDEVTLSYRLSIDPIYRLQAMAGAVEFANREFVQTNQRVKDAPMLLAGLGWLQRALDLSEGQYQRVTALHSDYELAFDDLFAQLVSSHRDYQAFDRMRMENDVVDYFKLYELLQSQKRLSEESARLTEELLAKVEQVIEPAQRVRYRELLDNIYPRPSGKGHSSTDA